MKKRRMLSVVFEGEKYVDTITAMESLRTDNRKDLVRWRLQGMPYLELVLNKQVKYLYHIPHCQRWFAGEEFMNSIITVTKDDVMEVSA